MLNAFEVAKRYADVQDELRRVAEAAAQARQHGAMLTSTELDLRRLQLMAAEEAYAAVLGIKAGEQFVMIEIPASDFVIGDDGMVTIVSAGETIAHETIAHETIAHETIAHETIAREAEASVALDRQITHYAGDECPGGHREQTEKPAATGEDAASPPVAAG